MYYKAISNLRLFFTAMQFLATEIGSSCFINNNNNNKIVSNIWDFFGWWFAFPKADSQPGWESSWAEDHLNLPTRRGIAQLLRGKGDLLGPTCKRASRKCGNVLLGLSRIDLCTCRSSNTAFSQHSLNHYVSQNAEGWTKWWVEP